MEFGGILFFFQNITYRLHGGSYTQEPLLLLWQTEYNFKVGKIYFWNAYLLSPIGFLHF